jgi:hypothetical protein
MGIEFIKESFIFSSKNPLSTPMGVGGGGGGGVKYPKI